MWHLAQAETDASFCQTVKLSRELRLLSELSFLNKLIKTKLTYLEILGSKFSELLEYPQN